MLFDMDVPDVILDIADTGAAIGVGNFLSGEVDVHCSYRADWQSLYQQKGWIAEDPVVMMGLSQTGAMHWPELNQNASPVMRAAADFGINKGIIISTEIAGSRCIAGLSTSSALSGIAKKQAQHAVREMHLNQLTLKAEKLTARQREIVYFFASGHSSRNVAAIMGISNSTINQYKKTITNNIGVRTWIAAINICARTGMTYHLTN
ncbi:MAG: autoinducer binding domain-containing protein [Rhodobacteraceae bacterium]|nr:autoinducer binding domain-containing protein [Paracoccaceae bacterium]